MKYLLSTITLAGLLFASAVSSHAQNIAVLRYATDSTIGLHDSYHPGYVRSCYCRRVAEAQCGGDTEPQVQFGRHEVQCQPLTSLPAGNSNKQFSYRVTLKNEGLKTIRAIQWEYVFLDRESGRELGGRRFVTKENIAPGRQRTLEEYTPHPAVKAIGIKTLAQPDGNQFIEKVRIKRITYDDGSIWQQAERNN
ncbi:MAG TPA: hypothetical protein VJ023_06050 [Pyrinomonadaceae bacterium]|nr:hypothetical protein [Pyrinomonadaceae bacterium]